MAELCRECFIKTWRPNQHDIDHIVMSEDNYFCEGCMNWGPYVEYIGDPKDRHFYNKYDYDKLFDGSWE